MNTTGIPVKDAVDKVLHDTAGLPSFLTGSSAAAVVHGFDNAYSDIDLFVGNPGQYFMLVTHLLNHGYSIADSRFERMWSRHVQMGFNQWHTNSMRLLDDATGTEVNVIYKRVDGHETTRLSQVIESFDFGLLGVGYETATGRFRDMRGYLFPDHNPDGPLPMMEYRVGTVGLGLMSQHIMLRTAGRYVRYHGYGYDMSEVKPTLVQGYANYALYKANRTKEEDLALGEIAQRIGVSIDNDDFDQLIEMEQLIPRADGLDEILAALE